MPCQFWPGARQCRLRFVGPFGHLFLRASTLATLASSSRARARSSSPRGPESDFTRSCRTGSPTPLKQEAPAVGSPGQKEHQPWIGAVWHRLPTAARRRFNSDAQFGAPGRRRPGAAQRESAPQMRSKSGCALVALLHSQVK